MKVVPNTPGKLPLLTTIASSSSATHQHVLQHSFSHQKQHFYALYIEYGILRTKTCRIQDKTCWFHGLFYAFCYVFHVADQTRQYSGCKHDVYVAFQAGVCTFAGVPFIYCHGFSPTKLCNLSLAGSSTCFSFLVNIVSVEFRHTDFVHINSCVRMSTKSARSYNSRCFSQ